MRPLPPQRPRRSEWRSAHVAATVDVVTDEQRCPPPEGWAAFFSEHGDALLRVAVSLVRGRSFLGVDAEDIVSESMRKLIKAGLPKGRDPLPYTIKAVTNTVRDLVKKRKWYADEETDHEAILAQDDVEADLEQALLAEDVRATLDELPEKEAHAIREKVMKGRHWSDVAPELEVTTSQGVGKIVNRGLAKLRAMPRFAEWAPSVSTSPPPSTSTGHPPKAAP